MFELIREDVEAVMRRDPATTSPVMALLLPGTRAVRAHRRHHWLWAHGHRALAQLLALRARHRLGIEIHPAASVGRRLVIDHGMGVVVGETAVIGDDCLIYQGVTLGCTGKQLGKRHPTLGDGVVVGANACVLGDIVVGDRAKVGAGAVVLRDVAPGSTAVGVPARRGA